MADSFKCPKCGKGYRLGSEQAGVKARCTKCGEEFRTPRPGDTPDSGSNWKRSVGGVLITSVILLGGGARLYKQYLKWRGPAGQQPPVAAEAVRSQAPPVVRPEGPIAIPRLPEVGPGRAVAEGVVRHEARLPGGSEPGASGKLWLYLPAGEHAPKSLPCVMITGAGSNLVSGMELGDGDGAEHLPYTRAGFAVLAYEMDGALEDQPSDARLAEAMRKFLAARAGLVNARIALEFLRTKVPQVDADRIYAAGHSSAGTAAVLFAEHEPSLKGCVAFAPVIDVEKRFGAAIGEVRSLGCEDLAVRYSPKNNESKLSCPIFLFHARADGNVPVQDTEACAARLRRQGKSVTLEIVPGGDHYNSMIDQGIPKAVAWLQKLAGVDGSAEPAPAQPEPPKIATNEAAPTPAIADPAGSAGEASIRSFEWLDADSDRMGGHGGHGKPDGNPDQHFQLVVDLPRDSLLKELTITSGGFHKWVTKVTPNLWSVGVIHDGKVVTLEQAPTIGTFSGPTKLDLYANSGIGIGPGAKFEIKAVVRVGDADHALSADCQRPSS